MKVAAIQLNIAWHDREANYARGRVLAADAAAARADWIVFPEMFATGFSMDTSVTPETLEGPTPAFFRQLARELGVNVSGGFVHQAAGAPPRNACLTVDRAGRDLALYAKIHQIALLEEDRHYGPGEWPSLFEIDGLKATCFICYDLRFPELFRRVADDCALVAVIASWPASRRRHWDLLLRARAVENQCYVLGVNRVGEGGGLLFDGGSALVDPLGETLADGRSAESAVVGEIDPRVVTEIRTSLPFLKDRKPHLLPDRR